VFCACLKCCLSLEVVLLCSALLCNYLPRTVCFPAAFAAVFKREDKDSRQTGIDGVAGSGQGERF